MPELSPFRGLRYNPRSVTDAATVLCPPYDVISPEERAIFAARDARNAVHVELPEPPTHDGTEPLAPYRRAAETFRSWQADGTVLRDEQPMIYVYEQRYVVDGEDRAARGFFCLLTLEEFGTGVRRHEKTMAGPKQDRLHLLQQVQANLSPVLLLYEQPAGRASVAEIISSLMQGEPQLSATDWEGSQHRLWTAAPATSGPAQELLRLAGAGPLTIADGHHRYETALRFRDEQRAGAVGAGAAVEQVMVLLYEAHAGGLSVLPTHRLVLDAPDHETMLEAARRLFEVQPVAQLDQLLAELERPGRLGLWNAVGGALLELRPTAAGELLPHDASQALRELDVSVLTAALPRLVGSTAQQLLDQGRLSYIKDPRQAAARVAADGATCFYLPATPVEAVLAVAAAGEQMPPKSTYFLPKAATGLVFNPLSS